MADTLVIVESPAKAKTISRYLGKRFIVRASMGHVRDLPKSQLGVDVGQSFQPKYITVRGKGDVLRKLRDARRKVKRIYLAADPDREGEAIAWHLAHSLRLSPDENCRVVFHEITKQAIKEAFDRPRPINMNLVNAQQARRILDRLVGYGISPLLWKSVRRGLSAGRVQSVAVKIILDREQEIRIFQPKEYWTITASLESGGKEFLAKFQGIGKDKQELSCEEDAKAVLARMENQPFLVHSVVTSQRKRNPAPPFITSTLQQEAARRLGFRAQKTMAVAQQLYEGVEIGKEGSTGLITYMRTDSPRISRVAQEEASDYIVATYGKEYIPPKPRVDKQRIGAQDAHEAVRPTSVLRTPSELRPHLTRDQMRLYRLIWERFVASQMSHAVLDAVACDIYAGDVWFRATGSKINFLGFMRVYVESSDDASEEKETFLPPLEKGQVLGVKGIEPKQHFTQPPPRYTESRLVRALEEKGIGRPSTYAPTLETIQKRGYVQLEEKRFFPSELGEIVVTMIERFFPEIINVEFTAQMESELDRVESGKENWVSILDSFYHPFHGKLGVAEREMESVELEDEISDEKCNLCELPMVYKFGRYGKFLACSGFPECRNTRTIAKSMGVQCPICEKGGIVERKSKKKRTFYGCDRYPECEYTSWEKPSRRPCPRCQGMMVEKRTKKFLSLSCIRAECSYQVKESL
ncbi:type I DNA topoisomerase [Pasteuria penetrans]|uniref:type I DNA topoisomerase n=1 Tax=Pasteuria penetrans TaxID=86005 RepID=UPI000FA8D073|nr:type I DNA topoisomerase [Pasteuria penetrans]